MVELHRMLLNKREQKEELHHIANYVLVICKLQVVTCHLILRHAHTSHACRRLKYNNSKNLFSGNMRSEKNALQTKYKGNDN